jgi:hypothetical protein
MRRGSAIGTGWFDPGLEERFGDDRNRVKGAMERDSKKVILAWFPLARLADTAEGDLAADYRLHPFEP